MKNPDLLTPASLPTRSLKRLIPFILCQTRCPSLGSRVLFSRINRRDPGYACQRSGPEPVQSASNSRDPMEWTTPRPLLPRNGLRAIGGCDGSSYRAGMYIDNCLRWRRGCLISLPRTSTRTANRARGALGAAINCIRAGRACHRRKNMD